MKLKYELQYLYSGIYHTQRIFRNLQGAKKYMKMLRKSCDILPFLNLRFEERASSDIVVQNLPHIVPASSTTANDGLTLCPQALGSAQSVPTVSLRRRI